MNDPFINAMAIISVLGMIIVIIVVIILARAETKRRMDLDLHGRSVTATITSVSGDGMNGYCVTAKWMNPQTGTISAFGGEGGGRIGECKFWNSVSGIFDN